MCDFHRVDPDCLAVQVDEGPARVAEGDGGVRLDVLGHVPLPEPQLGPVPADGADDAGGDGVGEGEGAAHGDDELSGADAGRVAHPHHGEVAGCDPHCRKVGPDVDVLDVTWKQKEMVTSLQKVEIRSQPQRCTSRTGAFQLEFFMPNASDDGSYVINFSCWFEGS